MSATNENALPHNPIWPISTDWNWERVDRWTRIRWVINKSTMGPNESERFTAEQVASAEKLVDAYDFHVPAVTPPPPPVDPPPVPPTELTVTLTLAVRPNGNLQIKGADARRVLTAILDLLP